MKSNAYFRALVETAMAKKPVAPVNTEANKREMIMKRKERARKKAERARRWRERQEKIEEVRAEREAKKTQYRDRAKEVREGTNVDYDNEIDYKEMSYETSKYLGGDEEHTHMVKGLDYILLNRRRQQVSQEVEEAIDLEGAYKDMKKSKTIEVKPERVFNTKLAKRVYHILFGSIEIDAPEELRRCQKFLPGRMVYCFDTDPNNDNYLPTPVHMSREDAPHLAKTHSLRVPASLLARLKENTKQFKSGKRARRKNREKKRKRQKLEKVLKEENNLIDMFGEEDELTTLNEADAKYVPTMEKLRKTGRKRGSSPVPIRRKKAVYFQDPTCQVKKEGTGASKILHTAIMKAKAQNTTTASVGEKRKSPKGNGKTSEKNTGDFNPKRTRFSDFNQYYDDDSDEDSKRKARAGKYGSNKKSSRAKERELEREAERILSTYKR